MSRKTELRKAARAVVAAAKATQAKRLEELHGASACIAVSKELRGEGAPLAVADNVVPLRRPGLGGI